LGRAEIAAFAETEIAMANRLPPAGFHMRSKS
jgi:hypothetical protein